jgi:hypothetical protein
MKIFRIVSLVLFMEAICPGQMRIESPKMSPREDLLGHLKK